MERELMLDITSQNIRHPLAYGRLRLAALPSVDGAWMNAYLFGYSGSSDVLRALSYHWAPPSYLDTFGTGPAARRRTNPELALSRLRLSG